MIDWMSLFLGGLIGGIISTFFSIIYIRDKEKKEEKTKKEIIHKLLESANNLTNLDRFEDSKPIYNELLTMVSAKKYPLIYPEIKYCQGNCFRGIGKTTQDINAFFTAINYYYESADLYKKNDKYLEYSWCKNNLGATYSSLAEFKGILEYFDKAIESYNDALEIRTRDKYPEYYAKTKMNIGNIYLKLSKIKENKKQEIEYAISQYSEALETYENLKNNKGIASIKQYLGVCYKDLFDVDGKKDNLLKSIIYFSNALEIITIPDYPKDYANAQDSLGNTYKKLSSYENKEINLNKAISCYKKSLEVVEKKSPDHARVLGNLGSVYRLYFEVNDSKKCLEQSIKYYNKSLEIYLPNKYPFEYARIRKNMGNAYRDLSRISDKKHNLKLAIECYESAQDIYKDKYIDLYNEVSNYLREINEEILSGQ
ncbi:MAG: tetratricopeptide repeat protein [Methanofastidiosum sp.]